MFRILDEHVFPFIRALNGEGTSYARHMRDARFQIPGPALLAKVVDKLDKLEMGDRDTKGDVYEYMLSKIASAGQNGQFRTPRHIIATMVELVEPKPEDVICDPAGGTCGFLVAAGEYLRKHHAALFRDDKLRRHFNEGLFNGFDFDPTMLRIGSMNMALHGVEGANISYRDSLAEDHTEDAGRYSLVLANPPFAGALDYEATAKDLQRIVKTKKTELLFVALFLRLLKTGGRAAVIVPDGVLFGSSKAHKDLRRILVEENKLDAVIKMPSGVFRPYAGVSTAILVFTRTGVGGTDHVWFYDVRADGWSLDDKRQPLLSEDKLGPTPATALTEAEARQAFTEFLNGRKLTADQLEFLDLVIDHLTARGVMDPKLLYEAPFTDFDRNGVEGVFWQVRRGPPCANTARDRTEICCLTFQGKKNLRCRFFAAVSGDSRLRT